MTENEAIVQLNFDMEMIRFNPDTGETLTLEQIKTHNEDNYKTYLADEVAITALMDIQQYRAIGTVERFRFLQEVCDLTGDELEHIANSMIELKNYRKIGTIEEFKALKEKSVGKKPNQVSKAMDKDKFVGLIGRCPNCGSIVAEDNLVCEDCFQVLDWSEGREKICTKVQ